MTKRKGKYWQRLKGHPGVPMATMLSFIFPLAGLGNANGWEGGVIAGLVASLVIWMIVLWTARTQPLEGE